LRKAVELLKAAGWEIKDGVLTNTKTGQQMKVEFLLVSPLFERIVQPYLRNLEKLGIKGTIRMVDSAQYAQRLNVFDYDVVVANFAQSDSPGNEQREYWGSKTADQPGARNTIGIKNPAVDTLIDKVIFAKDRSELVAATRALDRVLLWNFYVVPQFTYGFSRYARWDRFGHAELPKYARSGLPSLWWFDADKAARIGKRS
jgi:microcin C transport system substrate-binding protein